MLPRTVSITVENMAGSDNDVFDITTVDTTVEYEPPEWNISNKRYVENTGITIDPIGNREVTGSDPMTIVPTPGTTLPAWLSPDSQNSNIFTGNTPDITDGNDNVDNVSLDASNVDPNTGMTRTVTATFTITTTESGAPIWNMPNLSNPEDTGITIDPISNGQLTGNPTPDIAVTTGQTLPSWLSADSQNPRIFTGTTPTVAGNDPDTTIVDTIHLTASNTGSDGITRTANVTFTHTTTNVVPTVEHGPPVWNIQNKTVNEGVTITIDPITDEELTGDLPMTISITDAMTNPLPDWLPLSMNVLTGTAPDVDIGYTIYNWTYGDKYRR